MVNIYINDIVIILNYNKVKDKIKAKLSQKYSIKDLKS